MSPSADMPNAPADRRREALDNAWSRALEAEDRARESDNDAALAIATIAQAWALIAQASRP